MHNNMASEPRIFSLLLFVLNVNLILCQNFYYILKQICDDEVKYEDYFFLLFKIARDYMNYEINIAQLVES